MSLLAQGMLASLLAGLATGLGGLPVLLGRQISHRVFDAVLGFAAGVMLAVSGGALLVGMDPRNAVTIAAAMAGGGAVLALRAASTWGRRARRDRLGRGVRIALVVTLHNIVEGLAVVATFGDLGGSVGTGVALAIALHNIPEGLAVAEPLRRAGVRPGRCALTALASGMGEPLGALLAIVAVGNVLPPGVAAAIAAGAMVVLASTELIPEAFSHSFVAEASAGLLVGVLVALALVAAPW
ncbi:MAG: ZIP family metal transporter [Chloroflexota bacterium]